MEDAKILIKSYSPKELRALYGSKNSPLSWKAFNSWLSPFKDKIGKLRGKQYTPLQVKIIFESIGEP